MTPDQLAKQFGAAVKQRRRRLMLTQRQLGERIGVGRSEISRIESGSRRQTELMFELADALQMNLSTLVKDAKGQVRQET